jgi:hypothetical protein
VRTALKLILCYLVASYMLGTLSLLFKPLHAHAPGLVVWLMSPLLPYFLAADLLTLEARLESVFLLNLFVLLFLGFGWFALRRKGEA